VPGSCAGPSVWPVTSGVSHLKPIGTKGAGPARASVPQTDPSGWGCARAACPYERTLAAEGAPARLALTNGPWRLGVRLRLRGLPLERTLAAGGAPALLALTNGPQRVGGAPALPALTNGPGAPAPYKSIA